MINEYPGFCVECDPPCPIVLWGASNRTVSQYPYLAPYGIMLPAGEEHH